MITDLPSSPPLGALLEAARAHGVGVTFGTTPHAPTERRLGSFKGREILLAPDAHPFLLYFTVAHLYGHMVQITRPTAAMFEAVALVKRPPAPLSAAQIQISYEYEREAAVIGRQLLAAAGTVSHDIDRAYTRVTDADFRYLIEVLEGGAGGEARFAEILRLTPVPWRLIDVEPGRCAVDLADLPAPARIGTIVVV